MPSLNELEDKYQPALTVMHEVGIAISFMSVRDDKLYIKAAAPSQDAKNKAWDEIKKIDPAYGDLMCDITIVQTTEYDASVTPPAQQPNVPRMKTYTVKPGDTLSKIALLFYGNANDYPLIADANKDTVKDPDKIKPGMVLNIPDRPADPLAR